MTHKRKDTTGSSSNSFDARDVLHVTGDMFTYYSLSKAEQAGLGCVSRLPYCLKVLLENTLRHEDGETVTRDMIEAFSTWMTNGTNPSETCFYPARIMMHDVSGIPLIADLAAMRERMIETGHDGNAVNPVRPLDLIMDHSITAEFSGTSDALTRNMRHEFSNNAERYRVAKWAQKAFQNMRVLPPGQGICHQINLEALSRVVWTEDHPEYGRIAFPDSLLGGDSHTPMVNALSVLGWGVGAIEALSASLGEPVSMVIPDVIGVRLVGPLREGTTTTDLVLSVTRQLREYGVVQKFVEFFGPALDHLTLPERATISNMCPEYRASVGYFPTDTETLNYLRLTGRGDQAALVEIYCKTQGLWRDDTVDRVYSDIVEIDLRLVEACVAGPKLPQGQVPLSKAHLSARAALDATLAQPATNGDLCDGDIVIAAITSCTNTSNPTVMLAAGLLAKKAREKGLSTKAWVKTSLSPGSRVVGEYLSNSGLMAPLEQLGFHVTGYGCMTCCGGSGALPDSIATDIESNATSVVAVLSGNRNFEGRIHPQVKLAYLASPPLVVAYALAGTTLCDITTEPLGHDENGAPVYLKDIWPSSSEINAIAQQHINQSVFDITYDNILSGSDLWNDMEVSDGDAFAWDATSTYIVKPPFLQTFQPNRPMTDIGDAAVLALLGDNITTDHISPGSRIEIDSLAGNYLADQGVRPNAFSGFLQRRVNHEVMMRGTFNNPRLQNEMTPGQSGGWTVHQPSGEVLTIFDAALRYRNEQCPQVVIAGAEYGTGSSRDWAAKGAHLLGVKAIIAESFERIHRSNLVGMGVLPLQFENGVTRKTLGLNGSETVCVTGLASSATPSQKLKARFTRPDGGHMETDLICRLDTQREIAWYEAGGVMPYVLDKLSNTQG